MSIELLVFVLFYILIIIAVISFAIGIVRLINELPKVQDFLKRYRRVLIPFVISAILLSIIAVIIAISSESGPKRHRRLRGNLSTPSLYSVLTRKEKLSHEISVSCPLTSIFACADMTDDFNPDNYTPIVSLAKVPSGEYN